MRSQDQLIQDYRRDGVVRIRSFLSTQQILQIRIEIDRYIRDDLDSKPNDACTRESDGKTVRNLWRIEQHSDYFRSLARRPEITELIAKLVNGNPVLVAVETFNKPARIGSGVPYHQDNAYFCQSPPDVLTLWIAIDQVTVENGAVYFVKGSHKVGMLPTEPSGVVGNSIGLAQPPTVSKSEQFCAMLNPGDATIHHCQTIHSSDPNETEHSRLGLLLVYRGSHTKDDPELSDAYSTAVTSKPPA